MLLPFFIILYYGSTEKVFYLAVGSGRLHAEHYLVVLSYSVIEGSLVVAAFYPVRVGGQYAVGLEYDIIRVVLSQPETLKLHRSDEGVVPEHPRTQKIEDIIHGQALVRYGKQRYVCILIIGVVHCKVGLYRVDAKQSIGVVQLKLYRGGDKERVAGYRDICAGFDYRSSH